MTVFTFFSIIYYLFFVAILVLAFNVYFKLYALSKKITTAEISELNLKVESYQSVDSFLLAMNPNFPLSALVKILPGTFVGFGILGTFLGFSNGISGMSLSGNVDELFGKLDGFFGGLNTAFITSIAGVVLSVLFGTILYQWPLNKIKFHCARIYSELSKTLTPAEAAKGEFDAYIGSLQEMTKTLLAAKDTIEVSLTTAVEKIESLPEKFLDVGKSLEESVAPVKETFGMMQALLKNYAQQATAMQQASEQVQNTLVKFIETSEQTTEKVNQNLGQAISTTQNIQESNAKLNEDYRKMLTDYKKLYETLSAIQEKIHSEVTLYSDELKTQFLQLLASYSEQTREILKDQNAQLLEERKTTLDDYQKIDENISSILETVNKNLSDYSATVEKTLISTLEKIHSEVTLYSDELKTQFLQLLASYSEQTREILKDQNAQLLEERKTTLDDYQKIDENISSILESVNKNLTDYSATVEKTLISTLEEYNKTAQKVTESFFGEGK